MTIAGELINVLGFKLEGESNLRKFNQGMNDAENSAQRNADRVKKLGIAAGLTTTAVVAMGTSAVKNFAAFERQMTRIGITAGATVEQTVAASDAIQKLAKDFALPIEEAVGGLDTLTASGLSLEEAMAFLPSVLATAQAAGAATEDIANTAIKSSSALKISAGDMQKAFDIMVQGGKAGQFELRDMAKYIPDMANQFANLGYTGEEGLRRLIAILQTLREDTGSASAAATNATNIFSKMFSSETEKNFAEFDVNIRERMAAATKAGEDAVSAYVRITKEVLANNPTAKISDLFADQQFQQGMLSLTTSGESLEKFFKVLSNADVNGGVFRDLDRVLTDTDASIQKLSTSWDGFMKSLGSGLSGPVSAVLDAGTGFLDYDAAVQRGREKSGKSAWNPFYSAGEKDMLARTGGYAPTAADKEVQRNAPNAYRVLGRYPRRPNTTVGTGGAGKTNGLQISDSRQSDADIIALAAKLDTINSNLSTMTTGAAAGATITDARQDNRQFPVSVSAPVTVNVQQASQAPAAVGSAVSGAIGQAATAQAARVEAEPASP